MKDSMRTGSCRLLLSACVVMAMGCASTNPQPYTPNPPEANGTPIKLRVAVVELEDQSPPNGFHGIGTAFVPGVLYTKTNSTYTSATFTQFGSCLAAELRASERFAEVTYFPNWGAGPETFHGYDLLVSGHLLKDQRDLYFVTYGLSALYGVVAIMGAPSEFEDREVSLEVYASWRNGPSQAIMRKAISFSEPAKWFNLYRGKSGDWQLGEGSVGRSKCPTEQLRGPFLEVRKSLLAATQGASFTPTGGQP